MPMNKLDTTDPGKAADVFGRAVILLAHVCGMASVNAVRIKAGLDNLIYDDAAFNELVADIFPELSWPSDKPEGGGE